MKADFLERLNKALRDPESPSGRRKPFAVVVHPDTLRELYSDTRPLCVWENRPPNEVRILGLPLLVTPELPEEKDFILIYSPGPAKRAMGPMLKRIEALEADERAIIERLLDRIEQGRRDHGRGMFTTGGITQKRH